MTTYRDFSIVLEPLGRVLLRFSGTQLAHVVALRVINAEYVVRVVQLLVLPTVGAHTEYCEQNKRGDQSQL